MATAIPKDYLDLFEKRSLAFLALHMHGGAIQVTPVWSEFDGTHINISSVKGRLKDTLMRRDPRVTLCVLDPDNDHRYLEVRGTVAVIEDDQGEELKNRLVTRYRGAERVGPPIPGDLRITYRIVPEKVFTYYKP